MRPLFLKIFFLGLFSLLIPEISKADMAMGAFINYQPILIVVAFLGVWILEAPIIKDRLGGAPKRALFISLIANLFTSLLGFIIFATPLKNILPERLIFLIPIFLLLSILFETAILRFYYRQESWTKIIDAGISMNLLSYLFLFILLILDVVMLSILIIPYLFLTLYKFLIAGREIPKKTKRIHYVLIVIFSLALSVGLFFITINASKESSRNKAKDARTNADMNQIMSEAESIFNAEGNYLNLTCVYNDTIRTLCEDIEKQAGTKPVIYSSSDKYCAYVKLLSKKRYSCIDSSGGSIITDIDPSLSSYCNGITFICPAK